MNNNINQILTDREKQFIKRHGLSTSDFYDAGLEKKNEYHDNAKALGCNFVVSGRLCHDGCHRLRTRNGHCIECDPAKILYQTRHDMAGAIYVAACCRYCKIGMVQKCGSRLEEAIESREYKLNSEGGYGGETDWQIIEYYEVPKGAGRIEHMAQDALSDYKTEGSYYHDGCMRTTNEMFSCDPDMAIEALEEAIEEYNEDFDR